MASASGDWYASPQTCWEEEPAFAGSESVVDVGSCRLRCWDSGGGGTPVVLLHPMTGDGGCWAYQHAALAGHGYLTVSYSRRGHFGSDPVDPDHPGDAVADLVGLLDVLGIERPHVVGSAAGGFVALEFAVTHPDRVASLVWASSTGLLSDPAYAKVSADILPAAWYDLPHAFREVGPSYRAANPEGLRRWCEIEERNSVPGLLQPQARPVTLEDVAALATPVLLLTGAADLYMPPSRMRGLLPLLRDGQLAVIGEAGHAAYWEQPQAFNECLLRFWAGARR